MGDLDERVERFLAEGRCACPSVSSHREKLSKDIEQSKINIPNLYSWLKVLADPIRLQIVFLLQQRELCACELELVLKISQPTVSYHLQKLRKNGLVNLVREGRWTLIKIRDEEIFEWLEETLSFSKKV